MRSRLQVILGGSGIDRMKCVQCLAMSLRCAIGALLYIKVYIKT